MKKTKKRSVESRLRTELTQVRADVAALVTDRDQWQQSWSRVNQSLTSANLLNNRLLVIIETALKGRTGAP